MLYPSYDRVRDAKLACLPHPDDETITASRGEVRLQALLDLTAGRLLLLQRDVLETLTEPDAAGLVLLCKWGMDGSSDHSRYKQQGLAEDSHMFVTSLVPLRLVTESGTVIWNNATPNLARFCRPLALAFQKETAELTRAERRRVELEESKLNALRAGRYQVSYRIQLTMLDRKAVGALTETASTQSCTMCGATPKQMNQLEEMLRRPTTNTELGMSVLHCWIRIFEALLSISCRLQLQRRIASGSENQEAVKEAKKKLQARFREELGLRVSEARSGGVGNSNDGNTARRAFQAPEKFSECTGIDKELIIRLHVILQVISCAFPVNTARLTTFCTETAELYVRLYPWYSMPVTLHRLLIHSAQIYESCILPIGMMSEEAAEVRNKDVSRYRLQHTRKMSRELEMTDLLHHLLLTSDPLISCSRAVDSRKKKALLPQAHLLLQEPEAPLGDRQDAAGSSGTRSSSSSSSSSGGGGGGGGGGTRSRSSRSSSTSEGGGGCGGDVSEQ